MKTVWKWILGIVIVVIVLALGVGGFFLWRNYGRMTFAPRYAQFSRGPSNSAAPNGQNGQTSPNAQATPAPAGPNNGQSGPMMQRGFRFGRGPMMGQPGYGYSPRMGPGAYGPMMMSRGFGASSFFTVISLVFGLVKLAAFGLLLFGAYWLGRRSVTLTAPPAAAPQPAPQPGRKVARGS